MARRETWRRSVLVSYEGLTDETLASAVREIVAGRIDGDLGGHVVKKRVGLQGRGKRGGGRPLCFTPLL